MIKRLTENFQDDERYEYIKSKTVLDSDGWQTDYTMYYDLEDDKYIFIFGDNDLYDPTNESPDWECDTEAQANDWFDNYTGFDEEEDFDECYLSEDNYSTEHTYRVWYRPYGLDGDEEDYIDVTASNEDEARRFARTCGDTTDVELLESKQLNEDEVQEFPNEVTVQINKYSDRSGTYVKSRIIPNVVRIEDTDNYFYICTSDDYCYEYAKDSLYDGSYRYTILD